MMKFRYHRILPDHFSALRKKGRLGIRDIMKFTGRSFDQINEFLKTENRGDRRSYTPTMADVMILELCANDPGIAKKMDEIAERWRAE